MIGKLRGLHDSNGEDWVILDVNGVGYHIFCSAQTLRELPSFGKEVTLLIDTHVREDHIHLYGFLTQDERLWFRHLLTVQGVGGRVALAILSALRLDQLMSAIAAEDKKALTRAEGVGPKLALRIATELKEKARAMLGFATMSLQASGTEDVVPLGNFNRLSSDAVSALMNLGYGRSDAFQVVSKIIQKQGDNISLDMLIKSALQELSQK